MKNNIFILHSIPYDHSMSVVTFLKLRCIYIYIYIYLLKRLSHARKAAIPICRRRLGGGSLNSKGDHECDGSIYEYFFNFFKKNVHFFLWYKYHKIITCGRHMISSPQNMAPKSQLELTQTHPIKSL